jgi:MYXO-CTERM domain-containing protein
MKTRATIIAAVLALAAAAGVNAQTSVDKAFTANGDNCLAVNWSSETLDKYPNIASACQEVMQKDGKTYVKFDGEVKKVSKGGTEVVMKMKGGKQDLVLNPPEGRMVYVGGKKVPVKSLRPGDTLTFYVPEDRFIAAVMETPTAPVEEIPLSAPMVEQVAMSTTDYSMPSTASNWPLIALFGALAVGLAAAMRTRRALRKH